MMTAKFWNDERSTVAGRMWKRGASLREIAIALGCTRNTIVGFVRRKGLTREQSVAARADAKRRRKKHPKKLDWSDVLDQSKSEDRKWLRFLTWLEKECRRRHTSPYLVCLRLWSNKSISNKR